MTASLTQSILLQPTHIQSCIVRDSTLVFEQRPSLNPDTKKQRMAIRRLVERGFALYDTTVTTDKNIGRVCSVYLIAPLFFDLKAYGKYLVAIARGQLPLETSTDFGLVISRQSFTTEVWLDFTPSRDKEEELTGNAVLWTLSRNKLAELDVLLRQCHP